MVLEFEVGHVIPTAALAGSCWKDQKTKVANTN